MDTSTLPPEIQWLYTIMQVMERQRNDFTLHATDIAKAVKKELPPLEELADMGWCLRKIGELADEIKKEANMKANFIARLLAYTRIRECMQEGSTETTVRGVLALAIPRDKPTPKLPKPGTDEMAKLAEHFDIPVEWLNTRVVDFHWKHLAEYIAKRMEDGLDVPPGVDTGVEWNCTFRRNTKRAKK